MSFLVMPALDLKDGKCVQLVGGDPAKKLIEVDGPVDVARDWETRGAKRLHLIDLDGAIGGVRKNERIVREIVDALTIPIQFGGGMRSLEVAMQFLDYGVERVILGTAAIRDPETIEKLGEKYGKERITIALDTRNGYVTIRGWQETTDVRASEVTAKFEPFADEVLFTNVDVEGKMQGIDERIIKEVVDSTCMGVIVSGGISSVEDIKKAGELGAKGVVIGSALYTGRIDFGEIKRLGR